MNGTEFSGPILVVVTRNIIGWLQSSLEDYNYEKHGYVFWKAIQPYELSKGITTFFRMGLWWLGSYLVMQGFNVDFAPLAAAGSTLIIDLLPQLIKREKK